MKGRLASFEIRRSRANFLHGAGIFSAIALMLLVGLIPGISPISSHAPFPGQTVGGRSTLAPLLRSRATLGPSGTAFLGTIPTTAHAATGLYVNLTEQTLSLINNTLLPGNASTAHADGVTTIEYDPALHALVAGGVYSNAFVVINASRDAMLGGFTAGTEPAGLAFDPNSDLLWVANYGSNSVMEVNGSTDAIVAQISVGKGPAAVAFDPTDHRLFVADSGNYTNRGTNVSVIDTLTDQVTSILHVGIDPTALVYLPTTGQVYVTNSLSSNVTAIDASTLAIRASISVGSHPLPVFYDSVNKDLYVPTTGGNNITVLDPSNDSVVAAIPLSGGYPGAITLNPSNDHLFILGGTQVSVVDGSNQSIITKVGVASLAAYGIVYDPVQGDVYVAGGTDNDVKVLDGTNGTVLATIPSYYTADGVAFDPESGTVYVADQGSSNISVIDPSTRTAVATLDVAPNPFLSTGGPANGTVFVGAACPGGLAELNGTTGRIQACLSIPGRVAGLTYDSQNGRLYVSDGNQQVRVVDPVNGTVLDTIEIGDKPYFSGPWIMAVDPENDTLFVPNYDWANISIINLASDQIVGSIPAGPQPETALYDPVDNSLWVSEFNAPGSVKRFNATTYAALPTLSAGTYTTGLTYDPSTALIYATNSGSRTVSVFDASNGTLVRTIQVGTNDYSVSVDPAHDLVLCANAGSNNVTIIDGATGSVLGSAPTGLWPRSVAFAAGTDLAVVPDQNSGAVTLLHLRAGPALSAYPVTFSETGLPAGTSWSVSLGGLLRTSVTPSIGFEEPNGSLPFSVGAVAGLEATPDSGVLVVTGGSVASTIAFSNATYSVTFRESGLSAGSTWSVILGGIELTSTNSSINADRADGTYAYSIPPVGGLTATPPSGSIQVAGLPVTEPVTFAVPTYRVTFSETGLAGKTNWSVSVSGTTAYSTGSSVVFELADGTYSFTVATQAPYTFDPPAGSFNVSGSPLTRTIAFRAVYSISFRETGLPEGTPWTVTLDGTPVRSSSGSMAFSEPNGSYPFTISALAGYRANVSSGNAVVDGGPRNVSIGYQVDHTVTTPSMTGPPWILYAAIGGIAAAAVAAGVVLAVRSRRRSRRAPLPGDDA